MITLALLQLLADNGFGKIDRDLFWNKLGLGRDGVYIVDVGAAVTVGGRRSQMYEIYSRGRDDVAAWERLDKIREFIAGRYGKICRLPAIDNINTSMINNVTIMPPSTIGNTGTDSNGLTVFSITGEIIF